MAELVSRGYNVAVPEVDVGDDIFVVRDRDGQLSRVQVKTANAKEGTEGTVSAMFNVPLRQLETPHVPDMNYVFAIRHRESWRDFIIVGRDALYELYTVYTVGAEVDGRILFTLTVSDNDVLCKDRSLSAYRNAWSKWPVIDHGASP